MPRYTIQLLALMAVTVAAGCSRDTQQSVQEAGNATESAAGALAGDVRAELAVLDIDMGRRAGSENEVEDEVDSFAPSDTIYASVKTSGVVRPGAITSRWTFPDGSAITQEAQPVTRDRDANLLFFLRRPEGLKPGSYKFTVLIDGRDTRSETVTVR